MDIIKKITNSLLICLFLTYWLFTIYASFFASEESFSNRIQKSLFGEIFLPANYHMVSSVANQTVKTYYEYYKNNQLLYVYDIDSAYHKKIKKSFPSFRIKKELKKYYKLHRISNSKLGNYSNTYAFDTIIQNKITLQNFLLDDKFIKQGIENQFSQAENIRNQVPILKNADSVNMKILKKYIFIENDPDTYKNFEYWVQDSLLFKRGKKLKNEVK